MLNKVILMGRLVTDPELKYTPNNVPVVSGRIAVERDYKAAGQERRDTDFIDIVCWRNTAQFVSRYFKKGQMLALSGSLQTRQYETKDGQKRTAYEVVCDQVYFADSKRDSSAPSATNDFPAPQFTAPGSDDFEEIDDDSQLPF